MAKKSFKGENPALRYISVQDTDNTQHEQDAQYTHKTQNTDQTEIVQDTQNTQNAKETKSKRLNVLIRPSLFESASKVAHMQRISVNELIHLAVEKYVEESGDEVKKYDEIFRG